MNALQNVERLGLIVYRIESCHEIECLRLGRCVECAQIDGDELEVLQAFLRCHIAGMLRGLVREIHADEAASRIKLASCASMRPRPQPASSMRIPLASRFVNAGTS